MGPSEWINDFSMASSLFAKLHTSVKVTFCQVDYFYDWHVACPGRLVLFAAETINIAWFFHGLFKRGNTRISRPWILGWWLTWLFSFSISCWEFHIPTWRTPWFFRGVGIPPTRLLTIIKHIITININHYQQYINHIFQRGRLNHQPDSLGCQDLNQLLNHPDTFVAVGASWRCRPFPKWGRSTTMMRMARNLTFWQYE